jgi:hypothetical protein
MDRTSDTNEREKGGRLPTQTKDPCQGEPSRSSRDPARCGLLLSAASGPTAASDTTRFYVGLLREIALEHGIETPPPPSAGVNPEMSR